MSEVRVESPSGAVDVDVAGDERVEDLVARLPSDPGVTHVTFHATDGYAASIPLEQALADGTVHAVEGKTGVRLMVTRGHTTCLNVKAVTRIELTVGPGKHTVDPNPHTPARVPGWDT